MNYDSVFLILVPSYSAGIESKFPNVLSERISYFQWTAILYQIKWCCMHLLPIFAAGRVCGSHHDMGNDRDTRQNEIWFPRQPSAVAITKVNLTGPLITHINVRRHSISIADFMNRIKIDFDKTKTYCDHWDATSTDGTEKQHTQLESRLKWF